MLPGADNPWAPGEGTEAMDEEDTVLPASTPERPAWEPPVVLDHEDEDEDAT